MALSGAEVLTALALMMFIEGALYALFPDQMRSLMKSVLEMSTPSLVKTGMGLAVLGLVFLWVLKG